MNKRVIFLLMVLMLVTLVSLVSGCGDIESVVGPPGPAGPQGPAATDAPLSDIQQLVAEQNAYRSQVGQEPLVPGLDCTLYTVPQTTTAIIGATLTNVGSFGFTGVFNQLNGPVTAGLNILPLGLKAVYQSWYVVKCTGQYVSSDSNWHSFQLSSDDGSNLYFNGGIVINNDGLHGVQTVSGTKFIEYGFYTFELDFFQASGNEALVLNMDGALLDNTHYYH